MDFNPRQIEALRNRRKMSRPELVRAFAAIANRSPSERTIVNWEKGNTSPRADELAVLAQILGCKVQDFYKEAA